MTNISRDDCIFEKVREEVIPVRTNVICPKCKTGYLIANPNKMKKINDKYYCTHHCNNPNCKNFESIADLYPKIEYVPKESLNKEKESKKSITDEIKEKSNVIKVKLKDVKRKCKKLYEKV